MEKAHCSTKYHCETCGGTVDPKACSCVICNERLLNVPHPCYHCDGQARYLTFSPVEHQRFNRVIKMDYSDLSFLDDLGIDKYDVKMLERCLNAIGPGSRYWALAVELDRQHEQALRLERSRRHEMLAAASAVETIKAKLSAIEKIKMDLTYLMNERADLTKRIDALMRQMEKETTELRQAESAYAVTLVLAKEQC